MPTPPLKYDAFISYSRADFDTITQNHFLMERLMLNLGINMGI